MVNSDKNAMQMRKGNKMNSDMAMQGNAKLQPIEVDKKKFPWLWIGIGVVVIIILLLLLL